MEYWQISMSKEDIGMTSFVTSDGYYESLSIFKDAIWNGEQHALTR